jgi:D-alanine-D-alanine ligase
MFDKQKVTVGVLYGGISPERSISLKSGAAVAGALESRGWRVARIDVGKDLPQQLLENKVDVAWLALHGPLGEDGCVQGLLEVIRIPYTGSGVKGSAIAMDKIATKRILRGAPDLSIPEDRIWRKGDAFPEDLEFPVMVKTPEGGSTIGIRRCNDPGELEAGLLYCLEFAEEVLVERFVEGHEITVAVLEGRPLPVVAIEPESGFFDFEAKYTKGKTRYLVPAPIPEKTAAQAQAAALYAFKTLHLSGVARADFIVDSKGVPWFLEINTLPGMTATSLSPMAAREIGLSFEDLVEVLLQGASLKVLPDL